MFGSYWFYGVWRKALQEKSPTLFDTHGEKPYTIFANRGEKPYNNFLDRGEKPYNPKNSVV